MTGASGFIGGAVATALADAHHDVTGFGRSPRGWRHPLANYRVWDITTGPLLGDRDYDAVVHCAALADDWAPLSEAMRVNRTGTRHVLASFPTSRIVHLSTSSVYDAFTPTVQAREDAAPVARFLSSYSESKSFAELEVMGTDAVILRPHAVYGPGDTTLLPRVLAAVRYGQLVLPEGARVLHSLTHIDHLVEAVRLALRGTPGVYNIADAQPVMLSDVIREFLARRRVQARVVRMPYPAAIRAAALAEATARLRGARPRVTRYAVSQLGLERTLDLSAARERLGFTPGPTDLEGAERW